MSDQSESSAVYNILAFAFDSQHTASQVVKEVKSPGALDGYDILALAVVEQNPKGKVKIHEPWRGSRWLAIGDGGNSEASAVVSHSSTIGRLCNVEAQSSSLDAR